MSTPTARMRHLIIFVALVCGIAFAYPPPSNEGFKTYKDPETGLKYFWHPNDKGEMVKAFLEGGPPPVSSQGVPEDVHFFLYNKNQQTPHELKLDCPSCVPSTFVRDAPIKFVCHGFMSSYQSDVNVEMRNGYMSVSQFVNVIVVNWQNLARPPHYDTAAANTKPVGEYVALFINWLVDNGYTTFDKIHFSGHSLGAHVGGYAGSNTRQKFARLTGLDPALPLFGEKPDSDRIDPTDANFVDVIHTAGTDLGFFEARGHADFYPNGGKAYQPGCGIDIISTCSHSRCYEFFAESIWHTNGFPSYKCNSWEEYDSGRCSMTEMAYMGEPTATNARGKYYLRTNANRPFGQQ